MKFAIAFAASLAIASAQLPGFGSTTTSPFGYRPNNFYPSPSPYTPLGPLVNRVSNDAQANIVRYESDISPDGSYNYAYQTDNGIAAQAQGTPRDFGGNPPVVPVVSQGSFSWTSPEGKPIAITYIADENGYQPQGDAIPTPPAIPAAILRALEYIARNPPAPQKK